MSKNQDFSRYDHVVEALKAVDPSRPYGTALFDALARVTVSVAVEAVCLRLLKGIADGVCYNTPKGYIVTPDAYYRDVQVYMIQRSPDDTAYPGEWHCPGSVMRPGEEIDDVFERLIDKEFEGVSLTSKTFVGNLNSVGWAMEDRGHFLSMVYLCELPGGDLEKWFDVNKLPEKTVEGHRRRIIPCALGAFLTDHPGCS